MRESKLSDAGFHIIQKAVGSKPDRTSIYLPPQDHGLLETLASLDSTFKKNHGDVKEIDVTTIDHEYQHHVWSKDLFWTVKVDVEGWEEQVLRGAATFSGDARPVLVCEILLRPGAHTA